MVNKSKVTGTRWEVCVLTYMKARTHLAGTRWAIWRNPPAGSLDVGDLHAQTSRIDLVVECKAEKSINLPGYLKELDAEVAAWEKREGRGAHGVVVVKRRNHAVERGYVVMELGKFLQLVETLEGNTDG